MYNIILQSISLFWVFCIYYNIQDFSVHQLSKIPINQILPHRYPRIIYPCRLCIWQLLSDRSRYNKEETHSPVKRPPPEPSQAICRPDNVPAGKQRLQGHLVSTHWERGRERSQTVVQKWWVTRARASILILGNWYTNVYCLTHYSNRPIRRKVHLTKMQKCCHVSNICVSIPQ